MANVIQSVSGTNADGSQWTLSVGDRVAVEGDPDSADEGRISRFESNLVARVYWDSGVETPADIEDLISL